MEEVVQPTEIDRIREQFHRELTEVLPLQGPHRLGFRGGGATLDLYSLGRGKLYYASVYIDRPDTARRYWNAFGFYDGNPRGQQRIAVEINIPNPPNRQVAAFFARDSASNEILLLHDGRIGGGKEGVSRTQFLMYSGLKSITVKSSRERKAIVVAKLGDPQLVSDIEAFVRTVGAFKASVD